MSADTRAIRTARRRLAIFWVLTILYLVVIGALLITLHDVLGIVFIAVLVCSWFLVRWPAAKPHFAVLRDARRTKGLLPGAE
jgi:hypothetical protein